MLFIVLQTYSITSCDIKHIENKVFTKNSLILLVILIFRVKVSNKGKSLTRQLIITLKKCPKYYDQPANTRNRKRSMVKKSLKTLSRDFH